MKIPDAPKPKRCCEHWEKRTEVNTSALIATSCRSPAPSKHRLCLTNRSSTMTNALMQQPLSNICRIFFTKRLFFLGNLPPTLQSGQTFTTGLFSRIPSSTCHCQNLSPGLAAANLKFMAQQDASWNQVLSILYKVRRLLKVGFFLHKQSCVWALSPYFLFLL